MGIRETISGRPAIASCLVAIAILVAAALIYSTERRPVDNSPGQAAYTTDNGKTWFVDIDNRITPFLKDGQTAYGAALFSSDGGKNKFVGYLQRCDPDELKKITDTNATKLSDLPAGMQVEINNTTQIKRLAAPASAWVRADSPQAEAIRQVKAPDGQPATPVDP